MPSEEAHLFRQVRVFCLREGENGGVKTLFSGEKESSTLAFSSLQLYSSGRMEMERI